MRQLLIAMIVTAALCATGCGGTRYMEPGARIEAPPAGKALVNVHRPSTAFGSGQDLIVWDGEQVIGNTNGKDMFQYVCEPGHHVFHAKHLNVSLITAELSADKTYDIVSDCGPNYVPFQPGFRLWLNTVGPDRSGLVASWMSKDATLVLSPKAESERLTYQKRHLPDVTRYIHDFTEGDKKDKASALPASAGR